VLVETSDLTVDFGSLRAVNSVTVSIDEAEVVGLLGANGAGKTTLIRLVLGLLRPSSGTVKVFGSAPSPAARRRVGYVPQTLGLYEDLTVAENWEFTASAFGGDRRAVPEPLARFADELVGPLPLGLQRQVAFAVALMHRPELLVLDEPTSGVSPLGRARLWQQIHDAADNGAGVLVTTHNMDEAEQCDRLVVMLDGRVAASGTSEDITDGRTVTQVRSARWQEAFRSLDAAHLPVGITGATLRVAAAPDAVARRLAQEGIDADLQLVPANLEESFIAIVSGPARA
jgi:ABC-2 type transport system ATP-binding protein